MDQCEGEVLVEEVTEEVAHAVVGPAPVDEQEALQVAELGKGIVRGQHCLHALLSADAHTNVCRWGRAHRTHTSLHTSQKAQHISIATTLLDQQCIYIEYSSRMAYILYVTSTRSHCALRIR